MKNKQIEFVANIQVSKGKFSHPQLTLLIYGEDKFITLHKDGALPSRRQLDNKDFKTINNSIYQDDKLWGLLEEAICTWDNQIEHKYSLNPFTCIYTYCKIQGIDLFDTELFSV